MHHDASIMTADFSIHNLAANYTSIGVKCEGVLYSHREKKRFMHLATEWL